MKTSVQKWTHPKNFRSELSTSPQFWGDLLKSGGTQENFQISRTNSNLGVEKDRRICVGLSISISSSISLDFFAHHGNIISEGAAASSQPRMPIQKEVTDPLLLGRSFLFADLENQRANAYEKNTNLNQIRIRHHKQHLLFRKCRPPATSRQRPVQLEGVSILAPIQFHVNICKNQEELTSRFFHTFFTYAL